MNRFITCFVLALLLSLNACRTPKETFVAPAPVPTPPPPSEERAVPTVAAAPVITTPDEPKFPVPAESKLKLPAIFSDNMVLQQGMSVPVWGWANDGEVVSVSFAGQTVSATPRNGKWMVYLKNLKPGEPETLTVSGVKTLQFTNVLAGEVWVCSGQSNMEWALFKAHEPEAAITNSSNSALRVFQVPHSKADIPLSDISAESQPKWQEARPETVRGFSAVGYYFGRELHEKLGVPIGLIQSTWGGTPAEVWMRHEVLANDARYKSAILDEYVVQRESYENELADFEQKQEELKKSGSTKKPITPRAPWKPTELYNGMIAPILPYGIKGVIWYQGESNARRGSTALYGTLFPDLIRNWRTDWDQGAFPFLFVQLAPFKAIQPNPMESDWAELRDAQLQTTRTVPNTGMAVITDIGDEKDIHPTKKLPVGKRLALLARAVAYGEKIVHSGPVFKKAVVKGEKVILSFDHVGGGLVVEGGALKGFSIAGADQKFVWARAEILPDNTIAVWSPNINKPVAVRFGWADYPVVNLWNLEGLPASPFEWTPR
ncbi:MAG: sialate O-acetylesterase [Verrucomicrobia bacterium]|nr:sialate O-acetylesterase [Verrucomicrobiota bacterium]